MPDSTATATVTATVARTRRKPHLRRPDTKRWAWFGRPRTGGTWTVFLTLRDLLAPLGIELRWLALSADDVPQVNDLGAALRHPEPNSQNATELLLAHLDKGYHGAIVNVFAEVPMMNAARFLPQTFPRMMHVHSTSAKTIEVAHALIPHVNVVIAPSPCIVEHLSRGASDDAPSIRLIPHAVPLSVSGSVSSRPPPGVPLRIAYLGRLKDEDRGVLLIPEIVAACRGRGLDVTCNIAGSGPDEEKLRVACERAGGITLLGEIGREAVEPFLTRHHILISPANFEGFGLSVLEAMAVGCVPVVTCLQGVTDWLLQDGRCGGLFSPGDAQSAADAITALAAPDVWSKHSAAAMERAKTAFSLEAVQPRWAEAVAVAASSRPRSRQVPLTDWNVAPELRQHPLAGLVPSPVKTALRKLRGRR